MGPGALSLFAALTMLALRSSAGAQQGWSIDIETWRSSGNMSRECPYYHAGYDFEGRPVMIAEFGKWNGQKYADLGEATFHQYEKYVEKFLWRVAQLRPADPDAEDGAIVIFDLAGFNNRQLSSPKLVRFVLKFGHFSALVESRIAEFILINASHAAVIFRNLVASVAGRLAGRLEIFSTKRATWMTKLRNKIPADQLPPWYGGKSGYKPVHVFH